MIFFVHEHSESNECFGWVTQWGYKSEAEANARVWTIKSNSKNTFLVKNHASCIEDIGNVKLCESLNFQIHEQTRQARIHKV